MSAMSLTVRKKSFSVKASSATSAKSSVVLNDTCTILDAFRDMSANPDYLLVEALPYAILQ